MPTRLRYATRDEVAELLVPYLDGVEEHFAAGDWKNIDYIRHLIAALGEMGAPVDFLVKITADEPTGLRFVTS